MTATWPGSAVKRSLSEEMRVDSLKLKNFRNYEELDLKFSPGTNLFFGDNAQGKTNILEAVYMLGTTKSHRTARDREMIRFGEQEAHLRMTMQKGEISYRIDMQLKAGRAKGIAINMVPIRKAAELVGLGHYIFFSPQDLSIIRDGPAERRRFLDMELCQLDKVYVAALAAYNKTLDQRNRLLKNLAQDPRDMGTLDVWDEQLVRYGSRIIEIREKFTERLDEIMRPIHGKLSSGREHIQVYYAKNVDADSFAQSLKSGRQRDLYLCSTMNGPHKDDLIFTTDGVDLRHFGSQGQQRSAALSLKLAEIKLVKMQTGDKPVLLLDDVLSELDAKRQHALLESIGDIQTFITCTGIEEYEKSGFHIDQRFHVQGGSVEVI